MLADVGQGLHSHPEERRLDLGGEALFSEVLVQGDLPSFFPELLGFQAQRGDEAEVVQGGRSEIFYDVPGLPDYPLGEIQRPVEASLLHCRAGRMVQGEGL